MFSIETLFQRSSSNKNTRIDFIDMGMEYSKAWNNNWKKDNDLWINAVGVNSISDLILDPKYHYYFNGIKIVDLEPTIRLKEVRMLASDYADFIMLNSKFSYLLNKQIKLDKSQVFKLKPYKMNQEKIDHIIRISIEKRYLKKDYEKLSYN